MAGKPKTDTRTDPHTTAAPAEFTPDTGQEPDLRGVHIPGRPPGEFVDHGPVSVTHRAKGGR